MLHEVYISARGGTIVREDQSVEALIQALRSGNELEAIITLKTLRLSDIAAFRVDDLNIF
jgi:hypothetical protein